MEQTWSTRSLADHELIRKISAGSYGEVWLARSQLGAYRAIKIIQRARFDSARPFHREFEGIRRFEPVSRSHPGLMQILHVGRGPDADSFFYIMELADDSTQGEIIEPRTYRARTLAEELKKNGPLPVDQCVQIGIRLCRTLGFLHDRGLIHRDVKPSNVVFIKNEPKLADIGLVAVINEANTIVGTVGFIAPEGPNSPQSDIYSLGKLLYEISTGQDRNEFPTLPARPSFSDQFLELNEVVVKACNTSCTHRYVSAEAMASELELIATGRSVRRLHHLEARLLGLRKQALILLAALAVAAAVYYPASQEWRRARERQATLIGSRIGQGTILLQQGDMLGALPFFAEAARLDKEGDGSSDNHRLRIGSILAATPEIPRVWHLQGGIVRSCGIDGRLGLATVERQYVQVFDLDTGKVLSPALGKEVQPYSASFVPGGTLILTANYDDTARLVDWKTGQAVVCVPHSSAVLTASASPDGRSFITGCLDGRVFLCDSQTGASKLLGQHAEPVLSSRWSPSGQFAVTAGWDATARVWDVQTEGECLEFQDNSWIYSADFSPDERIVATAGYSREVRLWDLTTGKEIEPSLHHDGPVSSVRFSADGELILTASFDGTARLWRRRSHRLVERNHTLKHKGKLYDACFRDNTRQILTAGSDGAVTLWDFGHLPVRPKNMGKAETVPALKWPLRSPDGNWEARLKGSGLIVAHRRLAAASLEVALESKPQSAQFDRTCASLLAVDGTNVHLIDLVHGVTHILAHPNPVTFAQFSPDGATLLCASADKTLKEMAAQLWSVPDGRPIGAPLQHTDGVLSAAFSPDGRHVITASEDSTAVIWDTKTGKRVTPSLAHREKVYRAEFAKFKPWVVTASEDGTAVVWDSRTGDPLTPPFEHSKPIVQAEFVQNDTALLTTDEDGMQWKWRLFVETRSSDEISRLVSLLSGRR